MMLDVHRTRVFVAGGNAVLVTALRAVFEDSPNVVVGARPHVVRSHLGLDSEVMDVIRSTGPDVLVLTLPVSDLEAALRAIRNIAEACSGTRLLVLLENADWIACLPLLRAGASGVLGPDFQKEELFQALSSVADGKLYLDPRMPGRGTSGFGSGRDIGSSKSLSVREAEVLGLVARGYSNKAVAAVLNLSVKTVETYRARGLEKLGIRSRVELSIYATTHGWI